MRTVVDKTVSAPRGWLYWTYQALLASLALVVIWLISQPEGEPWVYRANLGIWFVFSADYLTRLVIARDRRRFVRLNIPDLLASLPIDLLVPDGESFEAVRLLRLVRFVRLLRAGAVLWRVTANVGGVLRANGLGQVLIFLAGMIIVGGIAAAAVEPEIATVPDGVWWALVTAATVGYGDIAPKTGTGRIVAAVLMVLGITTFGMVTAALTTHFSRRKGAGNPHVEGIIVALERWDDLSSAERRQLGTLLTSLANNEPDP
jgi:voltage-gated potassium channel